VTLQEASSKPEAFDPNLSELLSEKACFDDSVSHIVGQRRPTDHSLQLADTSASLKTDFYPNSVAEEHINDMGQCGPRLPTDEVKSVTLHSQNIEIFESDDIIDNVQLSQRLETAASAQLMTVDDRSIAQRSATELKHTVHAKSFTVVVHEDQHFALADSTRDSKLMVHDEAEHQMSEIRLSVRGDESKQEFMLDIKDVSETHVIFDRGYQLEDHHENVGLAEGLLPEKLEEEPAVLAFTENIDAAKACKETLQTAVCFDDISNQKTAAVQAMLFAVCSEEPSQEVEEQPVYLPVLFHSASNAIIDDVPQQPLMQLDVNATYVVCCVEPRDYEFPVTELLAHDVEMPEIEAAHLEVSEFGHFTTATIELPESECGIQELVVPEFGDFIVHLQSPETMTVREVEISVDSLLTAPSTVEEAGVKVVSSETCIMEEMANARSQYIQRLPTDEIKFVTPHPPEKVTVLEAEDLIDNVQLSQRLETAHSAKLMETDEGSILQHSAVAVELTECAESVMLATPEDQHFASVDSTGDSKLMMHDEAEQQASVRDGESKQEATLDIKDISEKHVVLDQGYQLEDRHEEMELAEGLLPEKLVEHSTELAFTRNIDAAKVCKETLQTAVCFDDISNQKTAAVQTMSFAECSKEPSSQEFEGQPVYLPVLLDFTSNAVIDDVPQQPLMQLDVNTTYVVCCVEPMDYEFPVTEFVAHDLEMTEIEMHLEVSEFGHLDEAMMGLPESECGVQELVVPEFGDFVVHLQSPETMTLCEVEAPVSILLTMPRTVETGETEVSGGTPTEKEMITADNRLSVAAKRPIIETQHEETIVKSDSTVLYDATDLSDALAVVTNAQPRAEMCGELKEFLEIHQSHADFPVAWKDTADKHGEMPPLAAKFSDSYSEQDSMRHLTEEDVPVRKHVDFAEMKLEVEYRPTFSEGDDTEIVTSDEWCVMEGKHHAGFSAKVMEDVTVETYEQVPSGFQNVSTLAEVLAYDTSTDETSTEHHMETTTCTSNIVHSD